MVEDQKKSTRMKTRLKGCIREEPEVQSWKQAPLCGNGHTGHRVFSEPVNTSRLPLSSKHLHMSTVRLFLSLSIHKIQVHQGGDGGTASSWRIVSFHLSIYRAGHIHSGHVTEGTPFRVFMPSLLFPQTKSCAKTQSKTIMRSNQS